MNGFKEIKFDSMIGQCVFVAYNILNKYLTDFEKLFLKISGRLRD